MNRLSPFAEASSAVSVFVVRTNRLVVEHWPWLIGGVVLLAGLVSYRKYRRDRELEEPHNVSAAPLESDHLVSVLIPAWNERANVARSIESFRELSYDHRELIMCAGGDDGTYEVAIAAAQGDDRISVLEQQAEMNKQAALNACLLEADGEVLYLVDGDCVLEDDAWNTALRPVLEGNETVVAGTSRPLDTQWGQLLPTYQYIKEQYERAHRPRYVRGLLGRNAVVERSAMDELETFDESVRAGTDYNLAKRLLQAGNRIRFAPNSRIQSEYPTSVGSYFSQQSRWLRNVFFLGRKWGEVDEARTTVVTCGAGVGMLVIPILGIVWLPLLCAWLFLICLGSMSRFRWSLYFQRVCSRPVPWTVTVSGIGLMFVEFAAWAYTLVELAIPSRRRKW